jgi:hypothetical protein
MGLRADLMARLRVLVKEENWTQTQAAERFAITLAARASRSGWPSAEIQHHRLMDDARAPHAVSAFFPNIPLAVPCAQR